MDLKIESPIVSSAWLLKHLDHKDLIILDATIPKITSGSFDIENREQIKNAIFFDIKHKFSDKNATLPNTVLSTEDFQFNAQELGINQNSCIVVYDDLGIYSSPRVWWMFQLMGFPNIAVLNGGFPNWKANNFPVETSRIQKRKQGNFAIDYKSSKIKFKEDLVLNLSNETFLVIDARSNGRFLGREPEPRKEVESGHIPNSKNLPFTEVTSNGFFKKTSELKTIFDKINSNHKHVVFSCGSGITASILALASTVVGHKNYAVYDGSWTEWGLDKNLPKEI